jgi:hypothetical protein
MPSIPVLALAGRRIDAPDATARFPLARVDTVRNRIRQLLADSGTTTLVCSAACGADLVGLQAARDLGLRRRVVLPFSAEAFRETSVVDRPGDWGPIFDELIAAAREADDLVLMGDSPGDDAAYARANEKILDEALVLAGAPERVAAALVWEGSSRGAGDATHAFGESARKRGISVIAVSTG